MRLAKSPKLLFKHPECNVGVFWEAIRDRNAWDPEEGLADWVEPDWESSIG